MKLTVRHSGNGPRLYAHPGGPGFSSIEFAPDCGGLEEFFEVAYMDPRGTGRSPRPTSSGAYRLDDFVEDLAETIVEPSYLLGFSHGGLVAQRFAARHPQCVRALILASTAARFSSDVESALKRKIEQSRGEPWLDDAVKALTQEQKGDYTGDDELAAVIAREMPLYFSSFGHAARKWVEITSAESCNGDALRYFNEHEFMTIDLRPELASIRVPTVIVTGADDFVCPLEAARELHAGIAGSRLIVIPSAGHMTFVEQPEAFRAAVAEIVRAAPR